MCLRVELITCDPTTEVLYYRTVYIGDWRLRTDQRLFPALHPYIARS